MELNLCNDNDLLRSSISETLSTLLFKTPQQERIELAYDFFQGKHSGNSCLEIPTTNLREEVFLNYTKVGIDLPSWFGLIPDSSLDPVMIVGMEPKRVDDLPGRISLSTPFGLHLERKFWRPSWTLIAKFISYLRLAEYAVYLTDISKLYGLDDKNKKQVGNAKVNGAIFQKELELVNPKAIIVLGKCAFLRVCEFYQYNLPKNVYSFVHPAAFGGNKNYSAIFSEILSEFDNSPDV